MKNELREKMDRFFHSSDIDGAVEMLERCLAQKDSERFAGLIGGRFTNDPDAVLSSLNEFIRSCNEQFDIRSVYAETNGFDINYDRWFFDFFGYTTYNDDPDDLDWLSNWQSPDWPSRVGRVIDPTSAFGENVARRVVRGGR